MGKFGIGARVRTGAGYEAEIVGKRKGGRELRFSDGLTGWWDKSALTSVLPAVDDDACDETCEVAYKVGDRVVFNDDLTSGVGVIVAKSPERGFDWSVRDEGGDAPSFYLDERFSFRTRHFSAADLRPFRLEAGRYYKTRDGRKVGPMEAFHGGFIHRLGDGMKWNIDGTHCNPGHEDIVAEWVEPAVEAAPEPAKWKPKVGDRVRWIEKFKSAMYTKGKEYEICRKGGSGFLLTDDDDSYPALARHSWPSEAIVENFELVTPALIVVAGKRYRGKSGKIHDVIENTGNPYWTLCSNTEPFVDRRFWKADGTAYNGEGFSGATPGDPLVEEVLGEPAPPRKFKVGDTVRHITLGYVGEIKKLVDSDFAETWWPSKGWGGMDPFDVLELATPAAPAFPIGAKVMLTATVTGHNPVDKHNVNVVIDGLPACCASHGIPATALRVA